MATDYQLILRAPTTEQIGVLDDYLSIELVRTVNSVGRLTIKLPYPKYKSSSFPVDTIIEIWRSIDGGPLYVEGETIYFVRKAKKNLTQAGVWALEITALDANHLLKRRTVAYGAKTAYTKKNQAVDDMAKAIVAENLGALVTDTARDLSAYISIEPDKSSAPVMKKSFPRRNVLAVLQELSKASFTAGTYMAFDLVTTVPKTGVALEFRTYTGQRGDDHRWGVAATPVVLDAEQQTIAEQERSYDWSELGNFIYAGGAGQKSDRKIKTAQDDDSIALSPFNRCEIFVDATNSDNVDEIQSEADEGLRKYRVKKVFAGRALDTPFVKYGRNYHFGDFVTVSIDGELIDVRIDAVDISVSGGAETVGVLLRSDE